MKHQFVALALLFTLPGSLAAAEINKQKRLPVASNYVVTGLIKECNEWGGGNWATTQEWDEYLLRCVNGELMRLGHRQVKRIWKNRYYFISYS